MSQVFSGDAVNLVGPVTITTGTETPGALGNFLNPPFGNAKAIVLANVLFVVGTGTTSVTLRIRRNPNSENTVVTGISGVSVTAGNTVLLGAQYADAIPDGRPVQYSITVQQAGATGNGSLLESEMAAFLISG